MKVPLLFLASLLLLTTGCKKEEETPPAPPPPPAMKVVRLQVETTGTYFLTASTGTDTWLEGDTTMEYSANSGHTASMQCIQSSHPTYLKIYVDNALVEQRSAAPGVFNWVLYTIP